MSRTRRGARKPQKRSYTRQQKAIKSEVKRALIRKGETKYLPIFSSSAAVAASTAGVFTSLTQIDQGPSQNNRIGNQVTLKKISFRMSIVPAENPAADTYNRVRVMIFKWKEDDGVNTPALGEILDSTSTSAGILPVEWPLNHVTRRDYTIIYDKVFTLNPTFAFNSSGVATGDFSRAESRTINVNRKLSGEVMFNGGSGVFTGHGKVYLLVVSDSAAVPHPSYAFAGNIFYKDL